MASGDTLCVWRAQDNEPPATSPAALTRRNGHFVLAFDTGATEEVAIFSDVLPRNYGGGGITVYLTWSAASATTGTIGWHTAFERIGDGQQDVDSDGFASDKTVTATTVPGTSGLTDITNVAHTNGAEIDSIAVGERFRIRIKRDTSADDASGDAELHCIELKET